MAKRGNLWWLVEPVYGWTVPLAPLVLGAFLAVCAGAWFLELNPQPGWPGPDSRLLYVLALTGVVAAFAWVWWAIWALIGGPRRWRIKGELGGGMSAVTGITFVAMLAILRDSRYFWSDIGGPDVTRHLVERAYIALCVLGVLAPLQLIWDRIDAWMKAREASKRRPPLALDEI